jgi:hypothetical protein
MKLFEVLRSSDINKMSDDEQIKLITTSDNSRGILLAIENPSPRVRLAAIEHKYWLTDLIKKPTEHEQMVCLDGVVREYDKGTVSYVYIDEDDYAVNAIWDDTGEVITLFEDPTANVIKRLLTEPMFINAAPRFHIYDDFVKEHFKDNTVLMNKWLRYGKNMREMG